MNIFVINGSPRGKRSNTLKVTAAFIDGMKTATECNVVTADLAELNIKPCVGCFMCWSKTPGRCIFNDDVHSVAVQALAADVVIWSFPLYFYGLPALLKAYVERQIPYTIPFMTGNDDMLVNGGHPPRFDVSNQRYMLISTCGFYPADISFNGIKGQFNMIYGRGKYDSMFIGEGELLSKTIAKRRCDALYDKVRAAGKDYVDRGLSDSERTELYASIHENIVPYRTYAAMADEGWGSKIEDYQEVDKAISGEVKKLRENWGRE